MAYQVRTVPLETRNRAAIPDRPKRSSLSPTRHSMLHAIRFLGAFRVVETVQRANKVARNTAYALEFHAFANETCFIWHADIFQFLPPACEEVYLGGEIAYVLYHCLVWFHFVLKYSVFLID